MKTSKRLLKGLLSATIAATPIISTFVPNVATSVLAADGDFKSGSGSITVTAPDGASLQGRTFTLYKLLDIAQTKEGNPNQYVYTIANGYKKYIVSALNSMADDKYHVGTEPSDQAVISAVLNVGKGNAIKDFLDKLDVLLKDNKDGLGKVLEATTGAPGVSFSQDNTTLTINNIEFGYYMLSESENETGLQKGDTLSIIISTHSEPDVNIKLKAAHTDVDKEVEKNNGQYVDSASHSIGDIVNYRLTSGPLSNLENFKQFYFKFVDNLSTALTYIDNPEFFSVEILNPVDAVGRLVNPLSEHPEGKTDIDYTDVIKEDDGKNYIAIKGKDKEFPKTAMGGKQVYKDEATGTEYYKNDDGDLIPTATTGSEGTITEEGNPEKYAAISQNEVWINYQWYEVIDITSLEGNENGFTVDAPDGPGGTLEILFRDLLKTLESQGISKSKTEGVRVRVNYQAQVNDKAKQGDTPFNKNDVRIVFQKDPDWKGEGEEIPSTNETPEDTVYVFNFTLDMEKVDQNNVALGGAKFVVTDESGHEIYFNKSGETDYKPVTDQTTIPENFTDEQGKPVDSKNGVYRVITSNTDTVGKGKFNIIGLEEGVYYIQEVSAPDDYAAIKTPGVKVTIRALYANGASDITDEQEDLIGYFVTFDYEDAAGIKHRAAFTTDPNGTETAKKYENYTVDLAMGERIDEDALNAFFTENGTLQEWKKLYGEGAPDFTLTNGEAGDSIVNWEFERLPETGGNMMFYLGGAAVVAFAGALLLGRKKEQEA